MTRGWFITLEGPDGGGKTTQAARLEADLKVRGLSVVRTREPGGDSVGEQVRGLLLHSDMCSESELLLFAAARAQNVANVVRPALESGAIVLCDRFTDSTVAYQGYGRGLSREFIQELNRFATGGLTPDRTYLLDVDSDVAQARRVATERDRLDNESLSFRERVRAGFLEIARADPNRVHLVDASRNPDSVFAELLRSVLAMVAPQLAAGNR